MKRTFKAVAGAVFLAASSHSMAVNIGGLEVPSGATFAAGQIYENVVDSVGDILTGYGKVDSINSIAVGELCAGCELTFQFGDYEVTSISPTNISFSGGWIRFYLGFGADKDFTTGNAGGSAGDIVEATNGTLFLAMVGHAIDAAGNTFAGTGINIGTVFPTGFGTGLADVDMSMAALANAHFDRNMVPSLFGGGNADFQLGSSFSGLNPVYPGEGDGGAARVRGSADFTSPIPEPQTYALMLAGLACVAWVARRRRF